MNNQIANFVKDGLGSEWPADNEILDRLRGRAYGKVFVSVAKRCAFGVEYIFHFVILRKVMFVRSVFSLARWFAQHVCYLFMDSCSTLLFSYVICLVFILDICCLLE